MTIFEQVIQLKFIYFYENIFIIEGNQDHVCFSISH
jgi:hypothetical protein